MPRPKHFAQTTPNKAAFIMAETGEVVTYLELEQRSNQMAHLFRQCGLKHLDHVAIMMENHVRFFEIVFGALRSGIIITPISTALLEDEVNYILNNCEAKLFITTPKYRTTAKSALKISNIQTFLMIDGEEEGYQSLE